MNNVFVTAGWYIWKVQLILSKGCELKKEYQFIGKTEVVY
jgi:hypothetical protein